jgi:hypothetical protein
VTALARPRSNCVVNYRPVLSSEKALQNNKHATVWRKFQGERNIGHGSQMGTWHQGTGRLTVGRKLTPPSTSSQSTRTIEHLNNYRLMKTAPARLSREDGGLNTAVKVQTVSNCLVWTYWNSVPILPCSWKLEWDAAQDITTEAVAWYLLRPRRRSRN